jgi:hypothetical protein
MHLSLEQEAGFGKVLASLSGSKVGVQAKHHARQQSTAQRLSRSHRTPSSPAPNGSLRQGQVGAPSCCYPLARLPTSELRSRRAWPGIHDGGAVRERASG